MTPTEYKLLRAGLSRCASGFLSVRRTLERDDPTIAVEVAEVFEEFAICLLDRVPEPAEDEFPMVDSTASALRDALAVALVVVSGCNADGAFDEQEQTIRSALAKAEGGVA